jgi:general L-amino acid transport system permease protein
MADPAAGPQTSLHAGPPKGAFLYDPRLRSLVVQILLCAIIGIFGWMIFNNVLENLARNHLTSGFGFLWNTAGFDISQTLIDYSVSASTNARAFWVGLLNTLLVSAIGIVIATVVGFIVGIGELSSNWLVAKLSKGYVGITRNIPLLLHLLFWYNAVLKALPDFRDSLRLPGGGFLNSRGLILPKPSFDGHVDFILWGLVGGIAAAFALRYAARRQLERSGKSIPVILPSLVFIPVLMIVGALAGQVHVTWAYPELGRFNVRGGAEILPEFVALLIALSLYTAAFIAEVVRAGLLSVSKGQTEAAAAIGLRPRQVLQLVIIPQATRVILPPLTNQYLNLTKNSTLAVAIGYPDFVQVFSGTVLNVTGQAIEVVTITLAVYLVISLATSLAMNIYQARTALVTR